MEQSLNALAASQAMSIEVPKELRYTFRREVTLGLAASDHSVPYGDGSVGAAPSQALRAMLRSHRRSGTRIRMPLKTYWHEVLGTAPPPEGRPVGYCVSGAGVRALR
jgi:hypothetical protein